MGIYGINDYNSFLQNYKVPTIKSVSMEDVAAQELMKKSQDYTSKADERDKVSSVLADAAVRDRQNTELEDISITFNKNEEFDYLGKDSDISKLDMKKAISDMQKDQLLQQYQYFVGSERNIYPDGVVIAKPE